jgi:uncharacterized repeat protein (TIGR02543 family)
VNLGTAVTRPEDPTRSGFSFDGWHSDTTLTSVYDFSAPVTANITLYAKWVINSISQFTVTVTFNVNGAITGSPPASQTVITGSTITLPVGSELSRNGRTFEGWNTNAAGTGTNYNAGDSFSVTGNITLYARWISNTLLNIANAQWKILNLKQDPLTAGTTTSVPTVANGRYTIFNNEPLAGIDGNQIDNFKYIRDSTIMYLDVPVIADLEDFRMYGIEARVRTTRLRDGPAPVPHVGTVILGLMTNPEDIGILEFEPFGFGGSAGLGTNQRITDDSRDRAPDIAGVRAPQNGGVWRGHITRWFSNTEPILMYAAGDIHRGTTLSGNTYNVGDSPLTADLQVALRSVLNQLTTYAENIGSLDGNPNKVEGFVNQEYIVRFMRTQQNEYSVFMFNTDGKFLHASRLVTSVPLAETLLDDTPHYFAFIVNGAEVEISDIRIFYDLPTYSPTNRSPVFGETNNDLTPIWVDNAVANAVPIKDTFAVRLYGREGVFDQGWWSSRNTLGASGEGFDYATCADLWENFVIDCQVLPVTMSQAVTWEVLGDTGIISLSGSGASRTVSRGTGTGEVTIRVTSIGSTTASHRPFAEFKIKIAEPITHVDSVIITEPAYGFEMDTLGQTVNLMAAIYPWTSPQGVTWAVYSDAARTTGTALVSITGNVLRVDSLPATDTMVYVIATSVHDFTKSAMLAIWISGAPGPEIAYEWKAADVVGIITLNSDTAWWIVGDVYWRRGAGTITVTNAGASCPTGSRFTIGTFSVDATSATVHAYGELDFSRRAKVFIDYTDLSGNLLQVYLNNNTTGPANSVLGGASRIFNGGTGGSNTIIPAAGTLELTIDPDSFDNHASLGTAFLQIRIGDGANPTSINITGVRIEYE